MRHSKEEILNILEQLENKKANGLESETLDFKEWIHLFTQRIKFIRQGEYLFAQMSNIFSQPTSFPRKWESRTMHGTGCLLSQE